jgi:DNA-binding MarR family transcriptional regulator
MINDRRMLALLTILETADRLQRGMPVSFLIVFLLIALDEGKGLGEYARRAGIDRFQMSRYMVNLGPARHGLIEVRPLRANAKTVVLTEKGRDFLKLLRASLQQETPAEILEARKLNRLGPYRRRTGHREPSSKPIVSDPTS